MRRATLLLSLALLLPACRDETRRASPGTGPGAAPAPPYDVKPLLRLLRTEERARLPRRLGLRSLGELPFYDMDLALDVGGARLAGSYTLHYPNRTGKPLSALPLLLHPNAPAELGVAQGAASLEVTRARTVKGPAVAAVEKVRPTLVHVRLAGPLPPGEWIKLEVTFQGKLRRLPSDSNDIFAQALSSLGVGSSGSGASDYGLLAVGDGIAAVASGYPMVAPFEGGKFDTSPPSAFGDLAYNDLVSFRLRTTVPPGHTIATNLVEQPRVERLGQQPVFTSVGTAVRDLVLVAGADLRRESRMLGPVRVSSVFRARDAAAGKRILEAAAGSLGLYQRRFGPYPYTELDVAEATLVGGAGGVEFPGMVLIAGMFYRQPSRSKNPLAMLTKLMGSLGGALGGRAGGGSGRMDHMVDELGRFVTAHEVAHQYFAGLIGSDCREHPSVDEPMAQFAAAEYMRASLGEKRARRLVEMNVKANYGIYRMLGGQDMPAAQPLKSFPSPLAYAAIVYGKAPYFYDALRAKLGPARFDRALRRAVDRSRFRLITFPQWVAAIKAGAGGDAEVDRLARRWFNEAHGDADLGMDESGDAVLALMLGQDMLAQLKQGMTVLGMKPADLFRMLMGKMAGGVGATNQGLDPLDSLKQLQQLQKGLQLP